MECLVAFLIFLGVAAFFAVPIALQALKAEIDAKRKAEEASADAELQKNHPEVWRNRELLKLEKERLVVAKELAAQRLQHDKNAAEQENLRRNVGVGVALGRVMGWW